MIFSIRDDDINYFTQAAELEANYGEVWNTCPISISVTPFQAGYPEWLFPDRPAEIERIFPLEDNTELVEFIRKGVRSGILSVMMHGYHHNIISGLPEYLAGEDLQRKTLEGRKYLEGLLGTRVKCFVPPHNALSSAGIEAVKAADMYISGIQSFRPGRRELRLSNFPPFLRRNIFLRLLRSEYPYPLTVQGLAELPYCSLGRTSVPSDVRRRLLSAWRWKGVFCLATHYWEFGQRMVSDPERSLAMVFRDVLNEARSLSGVTFSSLESMGESGGSRR